MGKEDKEKSHILDYSQKTDFNYNEYNSNRLKNVFSKGFNKQFQNTQFGSGFFSGMGLVIDDQAAVRFGDSVFIGTGVSFFTTGHPNDKERDKTPKEINVGNNVWIGDFTTVIGGVTIGDNVVIGPNSFVCSDIPSNVTAIGNPCKPVGPSNRKFK